MYIFLFVMDMATLQAVLVVAGTGSFTHAAERVFLTQPAVSKRIAGLKYGLGTRLFDRIGRRTPAYRRRARTGAN